MACFMSRRHKSASFHFIYSRARIARIMLYFTHFCSCNFHATPKLFDNLKSDICREKSRLLICFTNTCGDADHFVDLSQLKLLYHTILNDHNIHKNKLSESIIY